jgi:hypothetical protein
MVLLLIILRDLVDIYNLYDDYMDFVGDSLPDVVLWTIMLDCWLSVISS